MNENLTFREKIRAKAYENTDPYPVRPKMPDSFQKKVANIKADELASLIDDKVKYENAMANFKLERDAWYAKNNELERKFAEDIAEEHSVLDHPKRHRLFAIAWDMGHSSGLEEVASHYEELVDLIKP